MSKSSRGTGNRTQQVRAGQGRHAEERRSRLADSFPSLAWSLGNFGSGQWDQMRHASCSRREAARLESEQLRTPGVPEFSARLRIPFRGTVLATRIAETEATEEDSTPTDGANRCCSTLG